MRAKGMEMLGKKKNRKLYTLFVTRLFLDFAKDAPPPPEFVRYLVDGAVGDNAKDYRYFAEKLVQMLKIVLARADFSHDPEAYLGRGGRAAWKEVTIVPDGSYGWMRAYLDRFDSFDGGGYFVDNRGWGSLVWASFQAASADAEPVDEDAETLGSVGALFTRAWLDRLLSILLLEEELSEEAEVKSGATVQIHIIGTSGSWSKSSI